MAVDGKASSAKGFTKEELTDCFTLKEGCSCDTKRKLGKQWPEYTGPERLETTDNVLLELASNMEERLGHIHAVHGDESNPLVSESQPAVLDQESLYDTDEEQELEFE